MDVVQRPRAGYGDFRVRSHEPRAARVDASGASRLVLEGGEDAPRGRDDRALLANLQGAAVAHVLREFESPGLNQAMEAAFDERLASTRKELAESRATCEELRERVDATRSE